MFHYIPTFPLHKCISWTKLLSKTSINLKIMYYNRPPIDISSKISTRIVPTSTLYHPCILCEQVKVREQCRGNSPPIRELCHGNRTTKLIHLNISSTSSHLFIPPLSLLWCALPFLLLPKSLSSEGAPTPDSSQLHS